MSELPELSPQERAIYEWQMWVPGVGEEGQRRLKGASVLVTRIGGLGGQVAYQLAAAGVGRLILAHAGNVKPSDLNRQLLMTHGALGSSRVECAARRLRELNPRLDVMAVPENVEPGNAARLVGLADLTVDCAPLFSERLLLNAESIRQRKALVECAMYDFAVQVTTIIPGRTACVACRTPAEPADWSRRFPVFGAVSGLAGCLGAVETIKLITGIGEPLANRLLIVDLREMRFQTIQVSRNPACPACASAAPARD
jgi:molybdopterin/thiamine biosynthesis adenylyltransferase